MIPIAMRLLTFWCIHCKYSIIPGTWEPGWSLAGRRAPLPASSLPPCPIPSSGYSPRDRTGQWEGGMRPQQACVLMSLQMVESMKYPFRQGMRLEVVDKSQVSPDPHGRGGHSHRGSPLRLLL